jgi:hypothetical protein
MGKEIKFPNANEAQNKILNKIKEQKEKEAKAKKNAFDEEKDKQEFLYLWKHFDRRLRKILNDFKDDTYQKGHHGLEITVKIKKDNSKDNVIEKFVYSDRLKLFKLVEIE